MKGIADTGFIVAFLNRDDLYHDWAKAIARRVTEPLLTCEAVLAESAFKVSSPAAIVTLIRSDFLRISFRLEENLDYVEELAEKYRDRNPDVADLCLIRMSEIYPHHEILTVDDDFKVYRRNKRDAIPILSPRAR